MSMQTVGIHILKNLSVVCLKFSFNWASWQLSEGGFWIGNCSLAPEISVNASIHEMDLMDHPKWARISLDEKQYYSFLLVVFGERFTFCLFTFTCK